MSQHHLLPALISRVGSLTRHLFFVFESAARAIQVGLSRGRPSSNELDQARLKTRFRGNIRKQGDGKAPVIKPARRTGERTAPSRKMTMDCDNSFMITCPARSGSSMLVHLLRSHPEICAHDEVFSPEKVKGIIGTYLERCGEDPGYDDQLSAERYKDPVRFLYKIVLDPQGKRAVGFKLKHDELILPGYSMLLNEIADNSRLRIIHLQRRNLLRRYLSHYITMHVTHVNLVVGAQPIPEVAPLRLDPVACKDNFETIRAREQEFAALFASHPGYSISYEDLVAGDLNKIEGLLQFLGVSPQPLTTPTRKLGRDNLRSVIANFDELQEYFADSPFSEFFEPV